MRILFDECVPWPLRRHLPEHHVETVQARGWDSIPDGRVLRLAAREFDAFVTLDQAIPAQLSGDLLPLAIIVLRAERGRVADLLPLLPGLLNALATCPPGRIVELNSRYPAPRWIRERVARYSAPRSRISSLPGRVDPDPCRRATASSTNPPCPRGTWRSAGGWC